jgi:hypothetical protein
MSEVELLDETISEMRQYRLSQVILAANIELQFSPFVSVATSLASRPPFQIINRKLILLAF